MFIFSVFSNAQILSGVALKPSQNLVAKLRCLYFQVLTYKTLIVLDRG